MEDDQIYFECGSCGAEFSLTTDLEIEANWCPYCSESLDLARINSSLGIDYEYSESEGER